MKLSILSIPRDKYWIFTSSVLQLLHNESSKLSENELEEDEEDEDEVEVELESEETDSDSHTSSITTPVTSNNKRFSTGSNSSRILSVDNSSKNGLDSAYVEYTSDSDELADFEMEEEYFFHIAFTPHEATVICSTKLMVSLFSEPIQACHDLKYTDVKLLDETFISLHVDSDGGFDNSLEILNLTKPFSENGISVFFLSLHFNNIVLVPSKYKDKVELLRNQPPPRNDSTIGDSALAENTFELFKKAGIKPIINHKVKLLLTGARSGQVQNSILKTTKILLSIKTIPEYFAITRTSINEVSLILPKSARRRNEMGFSAAHIIGSTQDVIIPITIDFHKLPLDCTGIVAGVASKLFNGIRHLRRDQDSFNDCVYEMNYLSMARSGLIMVPKENVALISKILNTDSLISKLTDMFLSEHDNLSVGVPAKSFKSLNLKS